MAKKAKQPTQIQLPGIEPPEIKVRQASPQAGLWEFVGFYEQNIRKASPQERQSAFRLVKNLLAKGMEAETIHCALYHYAEDPFRKSGGPRLSMNIRSFFTATKIAEWQTPVVLPDRIRPDPLQHLSVEAPASAPSLTRFDRPVYDEEEELDAQL